MQDILGRIFVDGIYWYNYRNVLIEMYQTGFNDVVVDMLGKFQNLV